MAVAFQVFGGCFVDIRLGSEHSSAAGYLRSILCEADLHGPELHIWGALGDGVVARALEERVRQVA